MGGYSFVSVRLHRSEENRKETLDVLFKTLLHDLMTGKVRVKELDLTEVGRWGKTCLYRAASSLDEEWICKTSLPKV
jgi:hypothetical protein